MEDRFAQQMKKGILEMLVLQTLCRSPGHGYELINRLKTRSGGLLTMKEGTLYPILYRLEDEGLIRASWAQDRAAPKKVYETTQAGLAENARRLALWEEFTKTVGTFLEGDEEQ